MTPDLPPEDWPHRAASRIVAARPHRWHVQVTGAGPDVLLLHGAGASSHSWARLVPDLTRRHRVIALDLPGHGWTRSPRGRARLADVARDIATLCAQEGWAPEVVIGHSAGGAVGLELARQGLITPRRIVVVNGALEDFRGAAGVLFPIMAKVLALNPFTGLLISQGSRSLSQVRSILASAGTELDEAALAPYARLIQRRAHVDGTLAMMAQWSLEDLNRALPGIGTPTLFLHGEKDGAVAVRVAERAVAAMPDARLVVLAGVGHLAHEEAPAEVAEQIAQFTAGAAAE
ncbi:alpha/beta fold hydrolase BchO [Roseicyclus persicicus]|uniref:Alpha/beta fold hydrolase n=1 Tax=Roseicyclus persicicus TaxID=2650661 RepID=A0A7X6GZ35_9RHOB|nr:alpha/beta fold hydrolase BchO [Roseibacterium persicicum]NKX45047.1 alpha/beta fold hydrolase [Roseibacterium persicicum]